MTQYLMYVVIQNGTEVITTSQTISFNTKDDMEEDAKAEAMRFVGMKNDEDLIEVVLFESNGFDVLAPSIAYRWNTEDSEDIYSEDEANCDDEYEDETAWEAK